MALLADSVPAPTAVPGPSPFLKTVGDRVVVTHLHDDDGHDDDNDSSQSYEAVVWRVARPYDVLETKSKIDIVRRVRGD